MVRKMGLNSLSKYGRLMQEQSVETDSRPPFSQKCETKSGEVIAASGAGMTNSQSNKSLETELRKLTAFTVLTKDEVPRVGVIRSSP